MGIFLTSIPNMDPRLEFILLVNIFLKIPSFSHNLAFPCHLERGTSEWLPT